MFFPEQMSFCLYKSPQFNEHCFLVPKTAKLCSIIVINHRLNCSRMFRSSCLGNKAQSRVDEITHDERRYRYLYFRFFCYLSTLFVKMNGASTSSKRKVLDFKQKQNIIKEFDEFERKHRGRSTKRNLLKSMDWQSLSCLQF